MMRHEKHIGFEIKALSNLIQRKVHELDHLDCPEGIEPLTEMQTNILGFLCHNDGQEVYQRDIERVFYIRRSTASRILSRLEDEGYIDRLSVSQDARLKRLVITPKAKAMMAQLFQRILQVEGILTQGLTQEEVEQFMVLSDKIKQNLL